MAPTSLGRVELEDASAIGRFKRTVEIDPVDDANERVPERYAARNRIEDVAEGLPCDYGPGMAYEIVLEDVAARPIAAVHASVPVGHVAEAWRPALDKVWAFLRGHDGLRTDGHNIFVYHHPVRPGAPMDVDFGVEVSRAFDAEDEIVFTHTPAGHGRVDGARRTARSAGAAPMPPSRNGAVANHRPLAGVSWEIYGDPGDDPATLEVQVFYLLA